MKCESMGQEMERLPTLTRSGEIKKRLAEDCRRKSDICGSGISRAPLRGSGRHNRRSNSVEAGTTRRKSSRRRSPHDLGSADLATWLRETRPSQARSSLYEKGFEEASFPVLNTPKRRDPAVYSRLQGSKVCMWDFRPPEPTSSHVNPKLRTTKTEWAGVGHRQEKRVSRSHSIKHVSLLGGGAFRLGTLTMTALP
ncbi:hypothetical protein HPB50_024303 [Hyalomma asiaticum]|uniref:Uncharacterized protein n=1 Tax=Hyalomma asiaticum TaxID=266040 RepID=A0ACB7RSE7_HYAAI|nr:hypothetical protein HPB50_024303 [Hyalomma asiaticum]